VRAKIIDPGTAGYQIFCLDSEKGVTFRGISVCRPRDHPPTPIAMSAVAKTCAVLALAGSAAAFAPTMSLSANRRQVVQGGAAAAVAAPLLRSSPAGAASFDNFPGRAPVISVLDHRGCPRKVSAAPCLWRARVTPQERSARRR